MGVNAIALDGFVARYASLTQLNNISGEGTPVRGVPEPATWAMMLLGFGGIGVAMRAAAARKGWRRSLERNCRSRFAKTNSDRQLRSSDLRQPFLAAATHRHTYSAEAEQHHRPGCRLGHAADRSSFARDIVQLGQ